MDFKTDHPDFAAIETQIRRAHAERSVVLAQAIAGFVERCEQPPREPRAWFIVWTLEPARWDRNFMSS